MTAIGEAEDGCDVLRPAAPPSEDAPEVPPGVVGMSKVVVDNLFEVLKSLSPSLVKGPELFSLKLEYSGCAEYRSVWSSVQYPSEPSNPSLSLKSEKRVLLGDVRLWGVICTDLLLTSPSKSLCRKSLGDLRYSDSLEDLCLVTIVL